MTLYSGVQKLEPPQNISNHLTSHKWNDRLRADASATKEDDFNYNFNRLPKEKKLKHTDGWTDWLISELGPIELPL
jgi:hypothetical protein